MAQPPHPSVAIVGAGDYIGAAIARRFAQGGYLVHAGRRAGEKLAPLVQEIAAAGGRCMGNVAHLVIDAGVDTAWVRQRINARGGASEQRTLMDPASIGETYWQLHRQPRDAWTHELDARPFGETW